MRVEIYLRHPQSAEAVPLWKYPHARLRVALGEALASNSHFDLYPTQPQSSYQIPYNPSALLAAEFHSDRLSGCPRFIPIYSDLFDDC